MPRLSPYILIHNYLRHRDRYRDANAAPDGPDAAPDSVALEAAAGLASAFEAPLDFAVVGQWHKLLVYASEAFVQRARALEEEIQAVQKRRGGVAKRIACKLGLLD